MKLHFIEPGKPVQNAFIESCNGHFRDECLNHHGFISLPDAQQKIESLEAGLQPGSASELPGESNPGRIHSAGRGSPVAYGSLRARPARKAKAKPTGRKTDDDSNV